MSQWDVDDGAVNDRGADLALQAGALHEVVEFGALDTALTYHPERDALEIESRPVACTQVRVGGGT